MTDERDLHELAAPLLADPPHPPPPLDELARRVGRRRQRRARAIGACSVLAVVLVAAGILALPRDTELRVGNGTTSTTQPPPPFTPGPVQLAVTPESAPLTTARSIEIRNSSDADYTTCGFTYDLFHWDGGGWSPVAQVRRGDELTLFDRYDPDPSTECAYAPISLAPGESTSRTFDLNSHVWYLVSATVPPGTGPLDDGWYELREPANGDERMRQAPMGRFEITGPGAEEDPPAVAAAPIEVVVTPEAAALDAPRTIEVRNTSEAAYSECGLRYNLHRWDWSNWQPVAELNLGVGPAGYPGADQPPYVTAYDTTFREFQCNALTIIEPGSSATVVANLADLGEHATGGTVPPVPVGPLLPGVYELRTTTSALSSMQALGRFEITDDGAAAVPTNPTVTTAAGQTSDPAGGISVGGSVDVWPGGDLQPVGAQLPERLIAVDDDTIALAWSGPCNRPAIRVDVVATADEVEVRLHVGSTVQRCADDASDRWVLTTDLGGLRIGTRRLVARAAGSDGEIEVPAAPTVRASAAPTEKGTLPASAPISFQVPAGFFGGVALTTVPAPLLTSDHACSVGTYEIDGLFIPVVRMGPPITEPNFESCTTQAAIAIAPDDRMFGTD